jgi:two-component system, OmpR family, response regulator
MKILVVDDDADVRSVVRRALAADGHVVDNASSIATARDAVTADAPHLMVLDIGLPDGSGLDFCSALRGEGFAFPILILTARSEVALRVKGLDGGADDYLPKPFAVAELRARVRALGRRVGSTVAAPVHGSPKVVGDVVLDFTKRRATRAEIEIPITARQWAILEVLVSCNGRLVTRTALLEQVWGDATEASTNSLNVLVARLRAKLGTNVIRTLRNEGYAFGAEP